MNNYSVILRNGLHIWTNLTQEEAERIASEPTAAGAEQLAVPTRVAETISAQRTRLRVEADLKLEAAFRRATNQLLNGYDETTHLCDRTAL